MLFYLFLGNSLNLYLYLIFYFTGFVAAIEMNECIKQLMSDFTYTSATASGSHPRRGEAVYGVLLCVTCVRDVSAIHLPQSAQQAWQCDTGMCAVTTALT